MKIVMAVVGSLLSTGALAAATADPAPTEASLVAYRAELDAFRKEYGGARELPDVRFYLFGMGQRAKLIYRDGRLLDARSGQVVREWKFKRDIIIPPDYGVCVDTAAGNRISIVEDEQAVWIEESGQRTAVEGTRLAVKLPTFAGHRYARVLRVLHQELLVNITPAGPVPNFFVYPKPWYRDGAMMALAFRETGNLHLIRDWILGLREPFDRNNGGVTEPDNLGQALFLVSLVSDKNHPLVAKVLAESARFERDGPQGKCIVGRTDGAEHPVYQTKWLKYGLRALGLPNRYHVPSVADGYSALFWMDYRDAHVAGKDSDNRSAYPYLGWACDHFHGNKKSPIGNRDYPLTWEQRASQANYAALKSLDPVYAEQKLSTPHTWHAAEVFLYLLKDPQSSAEKAHSEIWRRFVDEHNVVLDYCDLDGKIIRPTPQDCREHKPSALSWGVPVEDGPMFNGLYLDAMVNRWKLTRNEADRVKARRLVDGLLFLSSLGNTPGFIARGVATDGKTTYPMGSNDQTTPWLYGLWRYVRDGLAEPAERGKLIEKFCEQVKVLVANGWRMPCDGGPSKYRGGFDKPTWEGAPRLLFVMKAMREFTGDAQWQQRYLVAANEKVGKAERSRLEICRTGMVFDPGQGKRHSWTGSEGVICLRGLWEMEADPALRAAYAQGLRASAELSAKSLPLCREFDVNGKEHFEHDWRVMNEVWKSQHSEAETVEVANAGLRVQGRHSPRLNLEKNYVREPCFAAWVVTLCPDDKFVAQHRAAILDIIAHYRYDRLYLSQFFPVESAWWRLQLLEKRAR
jgi:hypothetical protein